jgi:hypothetical protein
MQVSRPAINECAKYGCLYNLVGICCPFLFLYVSNKASRFETPRGSVTELGRGQNLPSPNPYAGSSDWLYFCTPNREGSLGLDSIAVESSGMYILHTRVYVSGRTRFGALLALPVSVTTNGTQSLQEDTSKPGVGCDITNPDTRPTVHLSSAIRMASICKTII